MAATRLIVLAFLSPWIVGFCVFFGYPLVMTGYLSFTHYDLLNPPRWIGSRELPLPVRRGQPDLAGGRQHALDHRRRACRCRCCSRSGSRSCSRARRRGVGIFRTVFYLPALVPPVAATLGFVYLLNPATGPVNTHPRQARDRGAALVQRPRLGEAVARDARPVGHRQHDGHLPRRRARRPEAPLRVGRARRRRAVAAPPLGDAAARSAP